MVTPSHVLCVDSAVPPAVTRALEGPSVTVDVVRTAADCVTELDESDCVVVTDSIPDADCVDLCERIRRRYPTLSVVVFPAAGDERLAGATVAAGADGYVPREQGVGTLSRRVDELRSEPGPDPSVDARRHGSSERSELLVAERDWEDFPTSGDRLVDPGTTDVSGRKSSRNVRKDGTELICEWDNTPLVDDGGDAVDLSFGRTVVDGLQRATAFEALQETTHELMRAASANDVAEIVIDATEHALDRPLAELRFYDGETNRLELAAATTFLERHSDDIPPVGRDGGLLWDVYDEQEPTVIDDAPTALVPYDIEQPVGNAIVHPLGDHGLLTVGSRECNELDVADTHLVQVLATTAEAALDRARRERVLERTKTIVETVADGVYAVDRDGYFVAVNDQITAVTGYDREELLGAHFSTILTDCSAERARTRVDSLESADESVTYEVTVVTAADEYVPSEVTTRLLVEDDVVGTVGIVRDISDRKRMARELADRRAKTESLHEVASRLDGCETPTDVYELTVTAAEDVLNFDVCVIDRAVGDYLEKAALSSHLADADYVGRFRVGEGVAGRTYQDQRTRRIGTLSGVEDGLNDTGTYESVLSAPLGEHGVFQAASTDREAFDADDEELVELLLSHVTDRLDQLASKAELRTERDRFAALFENVPDGVVSVTYRDNELIVDAVNPAFERIFGYDECDLVGEPLSRYIVPAGSSSEAAAINRRGDRSETVETEAKRRTADGLREFMIRLVPIDVEGERDRLFGLYTDITAQKQRQKRVEILNRVLRHDLRNGMNIVDGCAEMLGEAVDDGDVEYATAIQDRAADLIALAEKTRAVEQTLGRQSGEPGPIDVSAVVDRTLDRLAAEFPCVEIERSIPEEVFARADDYLELALVQLLENAAEHHDRPSATVELTLRDRPADGTVVLSVADDGPGIPSEERALLEEDREITQLRHASGLGLWLVDWVVTQLGGQLQFSTNEPRGTVVTLEIPRADSGIVSRTGRDDS